jgi:hypothetical protein
LERNGFDMNKEHYEKYHKSGIGISEFVKNRRVLLSNLDYSDTTNSMIVDGKRNFHKQRRGFYGR